MSHYAKATATTLDGPLMIDRAADGRMIVRVGNLIEEILLGIHPARAKGSKLLLNPWTVLTDAQRAVIEAHGYTIGLIPCETFHTPGWTPVVREPLVSDEVTQQMQEAA